MARYRKKPVVIEAIKLDMSDRDATRALLEQMGATPGGFDMPVQAGKACWWRQSFRDGEALPRHSLIIATLEGEMEALDGDWIIRGVKGELYPIKHEIFLETYEAVDAA